MKPRRSQKSAKPSFHDPKVADNVHKSASKSRAKSESYSTQNKPFIGKVFYLDLSSNKRVETLENDIKTLGGIVEKFFSKEIKYLVTSKKEARYLRCLSRDSPVPNPDSGHSSPQPHLKPHPRSHRDSLKGSSQGQADTVVTSRGKSLVERVVKKQERIQINKILSNALEWGVKILYIDDILAYIEKKKKNVGTQCTAPTAAVKKSAKAEPSGKPAFQKYKGGRVSKPFVKIEDSSRHYRPIYLAMPNMPEFNLTSAPPCSPFYVDDKVHNVKKPKEHRNRGARASASEERGQARPRKNRDRKRGGYCECCLLKYDNIKVHLQGEQHSAFSRSDEYLVVDRLVSVLPPNFIPIKTQTKRPRCSISSMLCNIPSITMEGGVDTKGTEEGQLSFWSATVEPQASPSVENRLKNPTEHSRKRNGIPLPLSHSEGEGKNCDNVSDKHQPKQRLLSRKQPCRQESPPTNTQRLRLGQTLRSKAERDPSRGDPSTCGPDTNPRLLHVDQEGQKTHMDRNKYTLLNHKDDLQCGVPMNSLMATSNQHQVSVSLGNHQGSPLPLKECERVRRVSAGDTIPGNVVCFSDSDRSDTHMHSPSPSLVRTLQRRVRDFKRKRRRVDKQTTLGSTKPSDVPSSSPLNLWQLFQSSEDMGLEFHGFDN